MRVLVACEFSGIVRDAFKAQGHDAWSCDLLPSERPGNHYQQDVLSGGLLAEGWNLMVAHPPCTHLATSGARWFKNKVVEQQEALEFVRALLAAPIPRIALENPKSIISTRIRKPNQYLYPWQYGHEEQKTICLWLKALPTLRPTEMVAPEYRGGNLTPSGQNRLGPSSHRWKDRSRTYQGVADAMAAQWGSLDA